MHLPAGSARAGAGLPVKLRFPGKPTAANPLPAGKIHCGRSREGWHKAAAWLLWAPSRRATARFT